MPTVTPDHSITIAFSVTDRAATAKWYEEHLGFKALFATDEMGWTELSTNTPGVTIGLGDAQEVKSGNTMPVFGVADLDVARRALEQAGVRFDGETIVIEGMVKVAAFFDPDGNALMIAQDLSK